MKEWEEPEDLPHLRSSFATTGFQQYKLDGKLNRVLVGNL